jgi:hypothetical protein
MRAARLLSAVPATAAALTEAQARGYPVSINASAGKILDCRS